MRDWKSLLGDLWPLENKGDYCNFQGAGFISLEKHITVNVHEFVGKLGHFDLSLMGLYILLS